MHVCLCKLYANNDDFYVPLKPENLGIKIEKSGKWKSIRLQTLVWTKSKHTRIFGPRVFTLWRIAELTGIGVIRLAIHKAQLIYQAAIYKNRYCNCNQPKNEHRLIILIITSWKTKAYCDNKDHLIFRPSKLINIMKKIIICFSGLLRIFLEKCIYTNII